jgi:hypothetical protein
MATYWETILTGGKYVSFESERSARVYEQSWAMYVSTEWPHMQILCEDSPQQSCHYSF